MINYSLLATSGTEKLLRSRYSDCTGAVVVAQKAYDAAKMSGSVTQMAKAKERLDRAKADKEKVEEAL